MTGKQHRGARPGKRPAGTSPMGGFIGSAVSFAINHGYVVGREVLVGRIPGIVVGYNIASFGPFVGSAYPLVVRTELGVTKCSLEEVRLA